MSQGGLQTCIREGLAYSSFFTSQDPQCLSTTTIASKRLKIVNFYVPPGESISEELEKILSNQDAQPQPSSAGDTPIAEVR